LKRAAFCFSAAAFFLVVGFGAGAAPRQSAPCRHVSFEAAMFLVCGFDARKQDLKLFWTARNGEPLRGFAALEQSLGGGARRLRFAMNAGMYAPDFRPVGLYVENGVARHSINLRDGDGNFALKPNGVFWIDRLGGAHVETSDTFVARRRSALWATQSGPMLVVNGMLHPKIAADGPSRNIRNGVGIRDADTAFFVISESEVSFGRIARFFLTILHCSNALYFDGAISSLWAPALNREDRAHELGPMVAVFNRR
jgi:uncharacterized protein YigE (DUF2233 family)